MSRHLEVSNRLKNLKAKHIARLDDLDRRLDKHETNADDTFVKFEAAITADENDMAEMERDLKDMIGNGGADDTSEKFSDGSQKDHG